MKTLGNGQENALNCRLCRRVAPMELACSCGIVAREPFLSCQYCLAASAGPRFVGAIDGSRKGQRDVSAHADKVSLLSWYMHTITQHQYSASLHLRMSPTQIYQNLLYSISRTDSRHPHQSSAPSFPQETNTHSWSAPYNPFSASNIKGECGIISVQSYRSAMVHRWRLIPQSYRASFLSHSLTMEQTEF